MKKSEIKQLFIDKDILNNKGLKKFCWQKYFDKEAQCIFNEFKKSYRTEDEAWFCLCRDVEPYYCEVCGQLAKFTGSYRSIILGYNTTCENCSPNQTKRHTNNFKKSIFNNNYKESIKKRKQTMKDRYGDENYTLFGSESFKQNLLTKYGDEHYSNHEKTRQTMLERYGVDHNFKLFNPQEHSKAIWDAQKDEILKKQKQNALEKYGVESANQVEENKEKKKESLIKHYGSIKSAYQHQHIISKETKLEKYGDQFYHNKEQTSRTLIKRHEKFENENNCTRYTKVLKLYGQGWKSLNLPIIYNGRFRYISNNYISQIKEYSEIEHCIKQQSKQENELFKFIKANTNYETLQRQRNIIKYNDKHTYEFDIYIPYLKIAFEYNGSYWHSTLYKDKYYHQNKTIACYENGIQLIHIYEFDWINKKQEIKNKIIKLLNGDDCSSYNWIPVNQYYDYQLSEPELINITCGTRVFNLYTEGKFIKKIK